MNSLKEILYPYQLDFVKNPSKRKLWLSSRQAGKSVALSYIAAQRALQRESGLSLCISTGERAANELLRKCVKVAEAVKVLSDGKIDFAYSADQLKFSTGSRIISLPSGNPRALRGWSASAVLVDEAAFIPNMEEVWSSLAPTITRDKDAEVVLASTPAGKSGFFFEKFNDPDWFVQTTTIEDAVNGGLQIDLAELRKTISDPEMWDREYMCRFADVFDEMIDVKLLDFIEKSPTTREFYIGVDVGSRSDRTVIVVLGKVGEVFYVVDIIVLHKTDYETQLKVLKEVYDKYRPQSGYVDQNGIGSMLAEYATKKVSARIRGFTTTSSNKTPAYESVRSHIFEHKLIFQESQRQLVRTDFLNVHRIVSEAGKVTFEAGRGPEGHSDVVSALVLALLSARQHPSNAGTLNVAPRATSFGNVNWNFQRF